MNSARINGTFFATPPKIAIVGTGAIGGYYGCVLARAGHDVRFLVRSDYEAVRDTGFLVKTTAENFRLHPVNAFRLSAEIGPCDLVIIALKTTANALLPELLWPLNAPDRTTFLTLQNGMGNAEALEKIFPADQITAGVCSVCVNRTAPGVIENYFKGHIQIAEARGPATPRTHALAALFNAAGIECRTSDSLSHALWTKLCWNVPFNGLAIAAGGITTDKIYASPPLMELAAALMRELAAAANAADGVTISEKSIAAQLRSVANLGAYKPSSLIDAQCGRPVEVESIWGEPLRRGQANGLPMGHLAALYALLRHAIANPLSKPIARQ